MIITRTPFRVSFAGGGSDLRDYYGKRPYGAVVSAAIRSYVYIAIHPYFYDKIRIKYSSTEDVTSVDEIKHPIVREALRRVAIHTGIEIASFADVPAGTGLGSSSSFTVGLLHALYAFKGMTVTKERLAEEACAIEIDILREPIGKQDQYAAAFGGINYIRFNPDESVNVAPVSLDYAGCDLLEKKLRLYYTGGQRSASSILSRQKIRLNQEENFKALDQMVALADALHLNFHRMNVASLGDHLNQGWELKQQLASGIGNDHVNGLMQRALQLGARGGKLLGAGETGFLLIYADDHNKIMAQLGCRSLPFHIDRAGSQVSTLFTSS
ncbi:MAG: Kinase, galactokinase/mevalonate kinase [Magnetococcales bacterium]|nr:Kinase, galactokinase/mevalonate kinase [Magnetococcales bacterium]HIJ83582.1 GHMP kinase [Magnetococcales bacterium]